MRISKSILNDLRAAGVGILGDLNFRGDCPKEDIEQQVFFNEVRAKSPHLWGILAFHPENEGLVYGAQFARKRRSKAMGESKGAPDIVIPWAPTILIELKRRDWTKSSISAEQVRYLITAQSIGCHCFVSFGARPALDKVWELLK